MKFKCVITLFFLALYEPCMPYMYSSIPSNIFAIQIYIYPVYTAGYFQPNFNIYSRQIYLSYIYIQRKYITKGFHCQCLVISKEFQLHLPILTNHISV